MRQNFTISEEDWAELLRLSGEAHRTPVMALSLADGLAGRDFASLARQRVLDHWNEIGRRLGFKGETTEPVDQARRIVSAEPLVRGEARWDISEENAT